MEKIFLKKLDNFGELNIPQYATEGSAGVDLQAAIEEDITLKPFERKLIKTGIAIALPQGYEAQIRPRSGLALRNGITIANSPGTIDSDYRGEIAVILINLGEESFTISRGMRIAQMVIAKYSYGEFVESEDLSQTKRGEGGFGSTGLKEAS